MPEGDTIHRTANRLRPALLDQPLTRLSAPRLVGDRPRPGERITSVDAQGKHLFITFSGGLVLETHMKMTGSWHLYEIGQRWRKPQGYARAIIEVPGWVAVCFSAPVVKIGPRKAVGRTDLGPDLCVEGVDFEAVVRRVRTILPADEMIGDALLDQRIAAGIGNVYKSEVCWSLQTHPFDPVGSISDDKIEALYRRASKLLIANLTTTSRTTVPGGLAVYGRRGRPCRRCGTQIKQQTQGQYARVTTWCPRCQTEKGRQANAGS